MDFVQGLSTGFAVATTLTNLSFVLLGAIIGTLVGIMPGLGASATIAILLPLTYGVNPATAIIMMAGVYCGSKYGGAVTSILMNLPGESSSVPTCLDGYPLALQGRKDIPTIKEAGLGDSIVTNRGFAGPPEMPDYAVKKLEAVFKKVFASPQFKKYMDDSLMQPFWLSSAEYRKFLEEENERTKLWLGELGMLKK